MGNSSTKPTSLAQLATVKVSEIVPKKQSLIEIDSNTSLPKALETLAQFNIYSAPVREGNGYCGFLGFLDVAAAIVDLFQETELLGDDFDLFSLDTKEARFTDEKAAKVVDLSKRNPLHPIFTTGRLYEAMKSFKETGVHRLPMHDRYDTQFLRMDNLLTQSALISYFAKYNTALREISTFTLEQKQLGIKPVVSVKEDEKAYEAFKVMIKQGVSAVAVVDANGKFVNSLTGKDIKVLVQRTKGKSKVSFAPLYESAGKFAALTRKDAPGKSIVATGSCTLKSTIHDVILQLAQSHFHRLFVLDSDQKPIGVVSLGDIIGFVFESCPQPKSVDS